MWIELKIMCNNEQTVALEKAGIKVSYDEMDWRWALVRAEQVSHFYPSSDPRYTHVALKSGEELFVECRYETLKSEL